MPYRKSAGLRWLTDEQHQDEGQIRQWAAKPEGAVLLNNDAWRTRCHEFLAYAASVGRSGPLGVGENVRPPFVLRDYEYGAYCVWRMGLLDAEEAETKLEQRRQRALSRRVPEDIRITATPQERGMSYDEFIAERRVIEAKYRRAKEDASDRFARAKLEASKQQQREYGDALDTYTRERRALEGRYREGKKA